MGRTRWAFHTPTRLVFGEGVSRTVGKELEAAGCSRPLVVTDAGLVEAGIVGRIVSAIARAGFKPATFDTVEANPSVLTVQAGVAAAKAASCNSVVAVGGGSPIDAAKAIAMMCANDASIVDYEVGKRDVARRGLPVITIPTTSGTGSEITYWSVITDRTTHRKFDVGSPLMAPVVALDDPELTYGLPADITAATGMDALTHAIEAFTTADAAPLTDALALEAIRLVGAHLRTAVNDGADREARRMMMLASATAGLAFTNAGLGAVHGLTAPIGGHLGVAHGQANAALLPFVMEYNLRACVQKYGAVAEALGAGVGGMSPDQAAAEAIRLVKALAKDVGIPTLRQLGVTLEMVPTLARDSMGEFSNNNANPVPVTVEGAEGILTNALG